MLKQNTEVQFKISLLVFQSLTNCLNDKPSGWGKKQENILENNAENVFENTINPLVFN